MIVYIVEMKTPSNIPLLTVAFQKLSSETLFNGSIALITLINIRLLKKPQNAVKKIQLHYVVYALNTSKLHNTSVTHSDFVNKLNTKYNEEKIDYNYLLV